jgi:hypothetical protein
VGDRYPTSKIREVDITIADEEGEEDTADITIDVHCYQGG